MPRYEKLGDCEYLALICHDGPWRPRVIRDKFLFLYLKDK